MTDQTQEALDLVGRDIDGMRDLHARSSFEHEYLTFLQDALERSAEIPDLKETHQALMKIKAIFEQRSKIEKRYKELKSSSPNMFTFDAVERRGNAEQDAANERGLCLQQLYELPKQIHRIFGDELIPAFRKADDAHPRKTLGFRRRRI